MEDVLRDIEQDERDIIHILTILYLEGRISTHKKDDAEEKYKKKSIREAINKIRSIIYQ